MTAHPLDAAQRAARDAVLAGGNHIVLGPPGSGKTVTAIETYLAWCEQGDPDRAVLLVPSRRAAATIGERIATRLGRTTTQVHVRTPASLAFAILRLAAQQAGEPAPTLLAGPDQDRLLSELIEGHLAGEGARIGWPEGITPEMQRLRAFRDELRDLLMRAAEAGLDSEDLQGWGHRYDRPEWVAAGRLLEEYTAVTILGELTPDRGPRYDAATILDQAVRALQSAADGPAGPVTDRYDLVIYDDYQDATLATARLLGELHRTGARVVAFTEPDEAVQAFRGSVPALVRTASRPVGSGQGALDAQEHLLTTTHRHAGRLAGFIHELTSGLPPLVRPERRRPPRSAPDASGEAELRLFGSPSQEDAAIARELREAHLREGIAWSRLAVIVRGHGRLAPLRRHLRLAGIPLQAQAPDRPLREEPAVRPFLLGLDIVTRADPRPTGSEAVALLTSVIGGLDVIGLRRLRRSLRAVAGARAATTTGTVDDGSPPVPGPSGDLLVDVLGGSVAELLDELPPALRRAPAAVAALLATGRAGYVDGLGTQLILWRMWESAGLAHPWQQLALTGGAGAARADEGLDAMVALFAAAEQHTERAPGANSSAFLHHLASQDFPADSLAARATRTETVALHTAASAAGGEWDLVIVAGVQEDVWPDLRIRDTVLGAAQLTDVATRRHNPVESAGGADRWRLARRAVREDELRSFISACARARRRLLVTAVLDADSRPSAFVDPLLPADRTPTITPVEPPLDLRGLVGKLRAEVRPERRSDDPGPRARAAAGLLLELARHGVPGADPAAWPGSLRSSSEEPIVGVDVAVKVSPSAIETAAACPLRWFLTAAGGRARSSDAQDVGNLIHEIAADLPHGTEAELLGELDRRWPQLDLPDTALSWRERTRAEDMVHKLAGYLAEHPATAVTEQDFEVRLRPEDEGDRQILLRGRVDRVEFRDGGVHVVDLKTGRSVVPVADVDRHPQLGAYQVALADGAFEWADPETDAEPESETEGAQASVAGAGASLLYVGSSAKKPVVREQRPLSDDAEPDWARSLVEDVAGVMAGAGFTARDGEICRSCPVRRSCPVKAEGTRLTSQAPREEHR